MQIAAKDALHAGTLYAMRLPRSRTRGVVILDIVQYTEHTIAVYS